MDSKKVYLIFSAILLILAVLIVLAYWVISKADKSTASLPVYHTVSEFQLTKSNNSPFGQADLLGKISIVDFIFTRCQGPCPVMSGHMEKLYHKYEQVENIQLVSITIDPGYDTADILQQYARRYNVTDDRWVFLYGELENTVVISEKGFLIPADISSLPMGHSTRFVLVDSKGQIRGFYSGTEEASIAALEADLPSLLQEL